MNFNKSYVAIVFSGLVFFNSIQSMDKALKKVGDTTIGLSTMYSVTYGSIIAHEIGHQATAKLLTGVSGTIHLRWNGGQFEPSRPIETNALKGIAIVLAGPVCGTAFSAAMYCLASRLNISPSHQFDIKFGAGTGAILNAMALIPLPGTKNKWANLLGFSKKPSDGYHIMCALQALLKSVKEIK